LHDRVPRERDVLGELAVRMEAPHRNRRIVRADHQDVGPRDVVRRTIGRRRCHHGRLTIVRGTGRDAVDCPQRDGPRTAAAGAAMAGVHDRVPALAWLLHLLIRPAVDRNLANRSFALSPLHDACGVTRHDYLLRRRRAASNKHPYLSSNPATQEPSANPIARNTPAARGPSSSLTKNRSREKVETVRMSMPAALRRAAIFAMKPTQ